MAQNIKGITIEIGGNTTKLQDALKGVNKQIYSLNGDLKNLNQALKLDPKNTELLAQKQDVLKRSIEASTNKLNELKTAQKQMGDYSKLTDQQKSSYNALSAEIAKTEHNLKEMNSELNKTRSVNLDGLVNALKKVGDIALQVVKTLAQVAIATGAALAGVVAAGVKSFAELEKAQKGSQRLFGESFSIVEQNAVQAYKTMGISASKYYDQVNTYAVGLKNALNGDSEAAAKLSNDILVAQADIVAATGADADAVSNAFAAVMRGNFTMIDNLRLGIKGSKEGMQEVIDKVNDWRKANGDSTRLVMGNYADMQQALVDYVKMQGVAGTAEKQMSSTIVGSISQMKAAFDNFLNGTGSPEQLADTVITVMKNIGNAIVKLAPSILSGITILIKEVVPKVIKMLVDLLPTLMDAVSDLIDSLLEMLTTNTQAIEDTIVNLIDKGIEFMTKNLPKIVQIAITLVLTLANALAKAYPKMQPAITECVLTIVEIIVDNLDLIIDAALQIIIAITEGLIDALPILIEKVPTIIEKLVEAIIRALPKIFEAGGKILEKLIEGIGNIGNKMEDLGKKLMQGLVDGLSNGWNNLKSKAAETGDKVVNFFKEKFGIHSPSKVMRDEIGKNLGLGLIEGIEATERDVNLAMSQLTSGINASVNPTINPTANSNPLIIQIENFNNTRQSDIEQLAQELEFYRKNSALARGGLNE